MSYSKAEQEAQDFDLFLKLFEQLRGEMEKPQPSRSECRRIVDHMKKVLDDAE